MKKRRFLRFVGWGWWWPVLAFAVLVGCQAGPGTAPDADGRRQPNVRMVPATFADVARYASPAVVNISSIRQAGPNVARRGRGEAYDQFFKEFFGGSPGWGEQPESSLGSGFLVDEAGLILTNNHVIQGADEIMVRTDDGKDYRAVVIGRDSKTDLALLRIQGQGSFPYLELGDSDRIDIGDWVVAIGNPFGLDHTVTTGILSARGRVLGAGPYDDFLQTDASINPGNSGGPLLNLRGEVVGINTAIATEGQGIGFAIPSNVARDILRQLRGTGRVIRGWLGVEIKSVTPEAARAAGLKSAEGALVFKVTPGGPADRAGLKRGDVIVSYDGRRIRDSSQLPQLVAQSPIGRAVPVGVLRAGRVWTISVRIGEQKP